MSADILHSFAECLRAAGLEVEVVQAPPQGRRVQGISGYSGLHLVEKLAYWR